jgi:squalene-hopene/tetraprenyl-beta-curcumene cyclase
MWFLSLASESVKSTHEEIAVKTTLRAGWLLLLVWGLLMSGQRSALRAADGDAAPDAKEVQEVLKKAVDFLKKQQKEDGSFSPERAGPGITAIVVAGLLRNGYSADEPIIAKALAYLEKNVKKDGGVYDKGLANYTTSVAMMAFAEANKGGKYDKILKDGAAYLKSLQGDDDPKSAKHGGVGYTGKERPDLSNTQYFLDGLLAAGVPKDDPAVQRALKFISRCQNLPGENNDQPFAKKAKDDDKGGLTYRIPLDKDDKMHAVAEKDGLRSMGAMTYAGLKSFLYAGVSKDDPRVKGAMDWIQRHYTLDENPGMGKSGLFYYYHTFAKTMDALGNPEFTDAKGKKHNWRRDLFDAIKKQQQENGGWINPGDKNFGEADPNLATAFAVLSLSYTKAKK